MNTKIAIGSDHAGFELKDEIIQFLQRDDYEILDLGTHTSTSCDYPDYAHAVAECVASEKATKGILICGSANGVAITANKHKGIRAAICWNEEIAQLARLHNDANIICIPARFLDKHEAIDIVFEFLNAKFEGGRHQNRVDKIDLK